MKRERLSGEQWLAGGIFLLLIVMLGSCNGLYQRATLAEKYLNSCIQDLERAKEGAR